MTEASLRSAIANTCQRLYARNLLAASDGNVSVRLNEKQILITPTGRQKGFLNPEDMAIINLDGRAVEGKPSAELAMHLHIFRTRAQAQAIIHAHPPHAVAWTLARPELRELPADSFSEVILGCGRIPIVEYARPGTEAMGTALNPYLSHARAMILARHGAVCWGESLEETLNGIERIEHAAYMLWLAESLGGAKPLPASEIEILRSMRTTMGDKLL